MVMHSYSLMNLLYPFISMKNKDHSEGWYISWY